MSFQSQQINSISTIPGKKMFPRKAFSQPGNLLQKIIPQKQQKPNGGTAPRNHETAAGGVDISLLDFMGIEEFLSILKLKTENNNQALWKASCALASQLKGSRALLSLGSYLSSNESGSNVLDRLIDTAFFILNAENICLLQSDVDGTHLVVTHSRLESALGMRIAKNAIVSDDPVSRTKTTNISDVQRGDPRYAADLDAKTGTHTRSLISIPILIDGVVRGAIIATNKLPSADLSVLSSTGGHPVFGADDEVLLGFIAANAGLAIKHSKLSAAQHHHHSSSGGGGANGVVHSSSSGSASRPGPQTESSKALHLLVDKARSEMDADKVSIFSYNDTTKRLECRVSPDIEGISIPSDRGIAGSAFRMGRVINVNETDNDDRHFRDVDQRVGYKTRSLLCAPIMDDSGRPVGVIEALNKKKDHPFTQQDEIVLSDFCPQVYSLLLRELQQQDQSPSSSSSSCSSSLVVKFVTSLMGARNVEDLASETRRIIMGAVQCDHVGLYSFSAGGGVGSAINEDHLVFHNAREDGLSRGTIPLHDVPPQVIDAIRSKTVTELVQDEGVVGGAGATAASSSVEHDFLPGCPARQAVIVPVGMDAISSEGSATVLVVTRTRQSSSPPFAQTTKDLLTTLAKVLGPLIDHTVSSDKQMEAIGSLEQNFQLANSTLSVLQDYIILLSSAGYIQAQNKDLYSLVGGDADENSGENGDQPQHFSKWLRVSNSPELVADINEALRTNGPCSKVAVRFVSQEFPTGIFIDYQLMPLDVEPEAVASDEYHDSFVLVLRPRKESISSPRNATSSFMGKMPVQLSRNKSRMHVGQSWDITSAQGASGAIEVAAGMISTVGTKYQLRPEIHRHIAEINTSIQLLLKNLEPPAVEVHEPSLSLVDLDIPETDGLLNWDFNVLEINDRAVLVNTIGRLFEAMFPSLTDLDIDPSALALYIRDVSDKYHDRPFHNLHHATTVTHFSFMLIHATNASQYLTKHHLFSVLLGAVVHDVDHPGNTNMFEINSQSELALLYNDQAVLENHHCSTAFRMMRKPSTNLFSRLPKNIAQDMRKTIVSCVMATDMSVHFQLIEETKKWAQGGPDVSFSESNEQIFLCKMLVHAADLSNPVRPFHMTKAWAKKISEEFNVQVAREQELGMPVLGFMMTPDEKALCKNETGFTSFVVGPMWRSLASLFSGLQPLIAQLDSNLQTWKTLLEQILKDEEAAAAAANK